MERTSLKELEREFTEKISNFTEDELMEFALIGFVAMKDYKEHLTVEGAE